MQGDIAIEEEIFGMYKRSHRNRKSGGFTDLILCRFFFEHIRRDWDDEDEGEHAFDAYLRARLRLYYDVISGLVPAPLVAR